MGRTHACPGCDALIPRHGFCCLACWYRLPVPHRRALQLHHRRHTAAWRAAVYNADLWLADHPPSTTDGAAT